MRSAKRYFTLRTGQISYDLIARIIGAMRWMRRIRYNSGLRILFTVENTYLF
ncbi:MAG: hypothetical protein K0R08_760 [Solimicrobium sp.]|jgi:hypothetical protein|nr:hypothetical protein [Solimicrobium sp.]